MDRDCQIEITSCPSGYFFFGYFAKFAIIRENSRIAFELSGSERIVQVLFSGNMQAGFDFEAKLAHFPLEVFVHSLFTA
jgi:hypothetical protein